MVQTRDRLIIPNRTSPVIYLKKRSFLIFQSSMITKSLYYILEIIFSKTTGPAMSSFFYFSLQAQKLKCQISPHWVRCECMWIIDISLNYPPQKKTFKYFYKAKIIEQGWSDPQVRWWGRSTEGRGKTVALTLPPLHLISSWDTVPYICATDIKSQLVLSLGRTISISYSPEP